MDIGIDVFNEQISGAIYSLLFRVKACQIYIDYWQCLWQSDLIVRFFPYSTWHNFKHHTMTT
jgi:hypothetical protein